MSQHLSTQKRRAPTDWRLSLTTNRPTAPRFYCYFTAIGLSLALPASLRAEELHPESLEVQNSVKKGLEYLTQTKQNEPRLGGKALIALAILKTTGEEKHPKILDLTAQMQQMVARPVDLAANDIYSLGIALIFLVNFDPDGQRSHIEKIMAELIARQKSHGGWGYPGLPSGDTSMTQYGVLGLWEAERAGFKTPVAVWEKVCNWLLRTQDPSGGFGYQGVESTGPTLVKQDRIRHSLTAGGLASLYLCEEHLGLYVGGARNRDLPSALRKVEKADKRLAKPRITNSVDIKRLAEAQDMGAAWFSANWNIHPSGPEVYLHYYLYALERYQSFREAMNGVPEPHPWYDEGARVLLGSQSPSGSWSGMTGELTDTSFAMLFLVRSTKKTLASAGLGSGALVAGRGIPKTTGGVRMKGGDIVASPLNRPAEQLLSLMEEVDNPESVRAAEGFLHIAEQADEETLNKHAVQLRRLAANERPEARIAAVKALGRSRQLDNVPTLIFALTDPDSQVVTAAIDALRFISRQQLGSPGTVINDDAGRKAAIEYWKKWYLSIRPDADLSDLGS